jgi:UDP-N-acetylmuramyl pentapeptide phosphotransferase/UDP-N-acetylglucosamine-1-phosphate transferase
LFAGYVAFKVDDPLVLALSMLMIGAILGFFLFNYPNGFIFLGDGGAYFLGYMLGMTTILLVMRNEQVSVWYAVLLLIYPVWETIFSIYRRIFVKKQSPSMPDAAHLHSLIFRRVMRWVVGHQGVRHLHLNNSMSSPFLWLLSAAAVIPATLLFRSTPYLLFFIVLFCVSYVWLYVSLVRFKTPLFLKLFRKFNR